MKYDITEIKVAQIHISQFDKTLLNLLNRYVDYVDTNKKLNEKIIGVHSINVIIQTHKHTPILQDCINVVDSATELYEQVKDFDYIQITTI